MSRVAIATIDLTAVQHNLNIIRQTAVSSKIMAVIKANAYGHGLIPIAKALSTVDAFAVAHFEEAITLRENFPAHTIVLLQGFSDEVELSLILSQGIQPVIHNLQQIELLLSVRKKNPNIKIIAWLKLNTGMNRLGIASTDFKYCFDKLKSICTRSSKNNETADDNQLYIMSHFANADIPGDNFTAEQMKVFDELTVDLDANVETSLANSAAIFAWKNSHRHWIRPGIALFGVSPFGRTTGSDLDLKPVMQLTSRVIAVKTIEKNRASGYGCLWRAPKNTSIAVIGIGYGDGYPRHIEENTPVVIHGKRYPIVGRVSMDMICVDIGRKIDETGKDVKAKQTDENLINEREEHSSIVVGDKVILWGGVLPVEEIAKCADTIAYELLCQVTARVNFEYRQSTDT